MAWCRRHCKTMLEGFATRKAAAAASNWKNETNKISMFSQFIRRNSSTLATLKAEEKKKKGIMEEESLKYKSLYLCFEEYTNDNAHVIQSIRLSHLLAPPVHGSDDLKLQRVAYRCGPDTVVPLHMSTGVVGSKIILFGDPSIDPNPELQPSQVFKISIPEPVLVEVDDKLYRFGGRCDCESFEVFEPIQDAWLPLDVPPRKYPHGFTHAIAGTKILLWGRNQAGVYMFDATHPEKGWTELDPCLGSYIPSIDGYDQLFVKLKFHHHGDSEGFLMFSINLEQPHTILAFHMSCTCDSLKPMEPLQLPEWLPKFHRPSRCLFFHLGGQKVGLVFSRDSLREDTLRDYFYDHYDFPSDYDDDHYDFPSDYDDDDNEDNEDDDKDNKDDGHNNDNHDVSDNVNYDALEDNDNVRVLVIIFEYEIAEESMDIKYKLLCTRCLEYSSKNPEEESWNGTSQLIGAYVM
ncbi:uncharacterized protein LOC121051362 [Rosa chinensis]|uniref:uncharacterized protein LOC121051362 n=1 Tax=Rosa chinensis TaxID=74649 RepID=UPI001AD9121B|nr:uncharacterized protein LOC121051362 [Rosa chinensis]